MSNSLNSSKGGEIEEYFRGFARPMRADQRALASSQEQQDLSIAEPLIRIYFGGWRCGQGKTKYQESIV